jgi:hypothetical protein
MRFRLHGNSALRLKEKLLPVGVQVGEAGTVLTRTHGRYPDHQRISNLRAKYDLAQAQLVRRDVGELAKSVDKPGKLRMAQFLA